MARMSRLQRDWYFLFQQLRNRKLRNGDGGLKPTTNFDFLNSTSLTSAQGFTLNFSRGTGATMFDSTGKLIYGPENLMTFSNTITNATYWGRENVFPTANSLASGSVPGGSYTLIEETTANGLHRISNANTAVVQSGEYITISVYIKAKNRSVYLNTSIGSATFDPRDGSFAVGNASPACLSTLQSDGGYRISVSGFASTNLAPNVLIQLNPYGTTGDQVYTGIAGQGAYVGAVQVERNSIPRTYNEVPGASPFYGPRFNNYNPVTLQNVGYRTEEQRTNLLRFSDKIDTVGGVYGFFSSGAPATLTPASALSVDGFNTASTLVLGSTLTSYVGVYQNFSTTSGATYTASMWLKGTVGGEKIWLMATPDGAAYTSTPCVLTTSWKRFTLTFVASSTSMYFQFGVDTRDGAQTGQPAQTIYVAKTQCEQGAFATTNIYTGTATVTRAVDVMTGPALYYNQTEGSMFISFVPLTDQGAPFPFVLSYNDTTNYPFVAIEVIDTHINGFVSQGAPTVIQTILNPLIPNTLYKVGFGYKATGFIGAVNGGNLTTTGAAMLPNPVINNVNVGSWYGAGQAPFSGDIQGFSYYDAQLTPDQFQSLTA